MIEAFEKNFGVEFLHAYGMTEATPLTHVSRLKSHMAEWSEEQRYAAKTKQGQLVPGLEMRVVASDRTDVPRDGTTMGEVWLRGPWIADEYYRDPRSTETFQDGWYKTGDVAAQDPDGYLIRFAEDLGIRSPTFSASHILMSD